MDSIFAQFSARSTYCTRNNHSTALMTVQFVHGLINKRFNVQFVGLINKRIVIGH